MTDLRETEEDAGVVPSAPTDYVDLKRLLTSLPDPTQPDVIQARAASLLGEASGSQAIAGASGLSIVTDDPPGSQPSSSIGDAITAKRLIDTDVRVMRTATKRIVSDDNVGTPPGGPIQWRHTGAFFQQGPADMDLDVVYSGGRPISAQRKDDGVVVSDTAITYAGSNVASIVVTRFGKTITVTPTYTGSDITHIDRVVT